MKKTHILRIFHPHIPAMVNDLENWLEEKTLLGWRLEKVCCWIFTFRKCAPYKGKYFIYRGFDASKALSFDFHIAKERYAAKKSPLNKLHTHIFEVDSLKIDTCYLKYIRARNLFYKRHYLKLTIISLICSILLGVLIILDRVYVLLALFYLLTFVYGGISLWILKKSSSFYSAEHT